MKKTICMMFALALISSAGWCQKSAAQKIPAAVRTAFKAKFPAATKTTWEKEDKMEFEANFELNGKKISAGFDPNGKWLQTETDIQVSTLPPAVQASIKNHFANFRINEASRIQSVKNGNCFEAEIEKGKDTFDVLFTSDGKILDRKKETEDTHNEKD